MFFIFLFLFHFTIAVTANRRETEGGNGGAWMALLKVVPLVDRSIYTYTDSQEYQSETMESTLFIEQMTVRPRVTL